MGSMLSPLLATKFHMPPASPNLVPRPHLVQALDDALRRPQELILVSAPAGFGKSTLVADWLRRLWDSTRTSANNMNGRE